VRCTGVRRRTGGTRGTLRVRGERIRGDFTQRFSMMSPQDLRGRKKSHEAPLEALHGATALNIHSTLGLKKTNGRRGLLRRVLPKQIMVGTRRSRLRGGGKPRLSDNPMEYSRMQRGSPGKKKLTTQKKSKPGENKDPRTWSH